MDFEGSLSNLENLIISENNKSSEDRNEATTRLHLIDSLIFDCLGWDRRECTSEDRFGHTYADYVLGDSLRYAIWEAKREGISFTLPAGFKQRTCKISTLLNAEGGVPLAIRQVLGYCQERSIAIGVVCNGHQIIAFLASRTDNVPPLAGQALVFSSLEDMREDFRVFWDNLSRPGTEALNLYRRLRSEVLPPPPEKLSQTIAKFPGVKNRNKFQVELHTLGSLFIEDLGKTPAHEENFLRECYSSTGALSQYALVGKQILQSRYPANQRQELRVDRMDASGGQRWSFSTFDRAGVCKRHYKTAHNRHG